MGLPNVSRQLNAPAMLASLAEITDEPPGLTRTFLSPASERAKVLVGAWMRDAGLEVFEDKVGNLIGRRTCSDPGAPVVACGSHLDTVRDAGRFDGAVGIVAGIVAASDLGDVALPYHLEVVAFSDEEGVRFQSTYLGSRFYAGDDSVLNSEVRDAGGTTISEAVASHTPSFPSPPPRRLVAYIEAHIEQGPVLEKEALSLGAVTAIAGQTRLRINLDGTAGHAGTTPMLHRQDALAGAAEGIVFLEQLARESPGMVATVGCLDLRSPASNVIPGFASFSVDIRHADDAIRASFVNLAISGLRSRATSRDLKIEVLTLLDSPAVLCDPPMTALVAEAISKNQNACPRLTSGAGHDAVALSATARVAMIFVRCQDGVSHHPDEYSSVEDISAAIRVLTEFLREFRPE